MSNEFFEADNVSALSTEDFGRQLDDKVEKVNQLNAQSDKEWSIEDIDPILQVIVQLFDGELPPLSFIEAVRSHYTGIKQKILTDEIPSLMREAGLEKATTSDGTTVSIRQEVSVSAKNKSALYQWLESQGYGDHIKTTLTFGKGEFDEHTKTVLDEIGASYNAKEDVHAQTLKKIFRDRVEEGEELPPLNVATISIFELAKTSK